MTDDPHRWKEKGRIVREGGVGGKVIMGRKETCGEGIDMRGSGDSWWEEEKEVEDALNTTAVHHLDRSLRAAKRQK